MTENIQYDDILIIEDDLQVESKIDSTMLDNESDAWTVICADDDITTHRSTAFAFDNILIEGKKIQLISAYSGAETIEKIIAYPNAIALLLDVVMETPQAGLDCIRIIREQLGRKAIRIIVRSGAPGLIGELEAVKRFDISDWRPKSELTQNKLLASATLAVRSFNEIQALEQKQEGLDQALSFLERLAKDSSDALLIPQILSSLDSITKSTTGLLLRTPENIYLRFSNDQQHFSSQTFTTELNFEQWILQTPFVEYKLESANISSIILEISLIISKDVILKLNLPIVSALIRALRTASIWRVKSTIERETVLRDPSTGLLSRSGFIKKSQHIVERNPSEDWALYLIDLAGFGRVNAALGHEAGDNILSDAAARITNIAKPYPVARIASDAFAVLMPKSAYNPKEFESSFSEPLDSGQIPVSMKTRTGAVLIKPQLPPTHWLTQATAALDEAKSAGITGGVPRWFDPALESKAVERIEISQKLFQTLKNQKGLYMVYQPQIVLKTGEIFGAEALIRWRDENGNMIPPDKFVPIAEQSGLVEPLSDFAMLNSLLMLKKSKSLGLGLAKISVNISAVEFESDDLIHRVQKALNSAQMPAESLELEITETAAAKDPERMIGILDKLRKLGVLIAIDDFGSGYSSLAQLARLPVDTIKIDRSFVQAIGEVGSLTGIPKMIIDLGKSLSMEIVAEGVETSLQAKTLLSMGADSAQGWLYAKAMDEAEFFEFLTKAPYLKF